MGWRDSRRCESFYFTVLLHSLLYRRRTLGNVRVSVFVPVTVVEPTGSVEIVNFAFPPLSCPVPSGVFPAVKVTGPPEGLSQVTAIGCGVRQQSSCSLLGNSCSQNAMDTSAVLYL